MALPKVSRSRMKLLRLFLLLSFVITACHQPQPIQPLELELKTLVERVNQDQGFNGVVGLVLNDQEPILIFSGRQRLDSVSAPLSAQDYFHLSSNSKLFTGLALLQLMEEYGLSPDDPIGPYFPELKGDLTKVSIQQLANHRSAIHDYLSLQETNEGPADNARALALISELDTTVYPSGERWGYTNSGYVLMALLVERISGMSFQTYLQEKVLFPIGLMDIRMHPEPKGVLAGFRDSAVSDFDSHTIGDAGLYFRASDMLKFLEEQPQLARSIQQAKDWSSPWTDPSWRYGFGWFFSTDSLGSFRAHSGRSGGFESYIRINENGGPQFFILSNHANGSTRRLRMEITKMLLQAAEHSDS